MQLLIVTEVGIQGDYLERSFLFLRAVFYSINNPKQNGKKLSEKDRGNWHNKTWKHCLLKQQIFRCLHNPCGLSKEGWGKTCLCNDLTHLERVCCRNYLLNLYWKKHHKCFVLFCFLFLLQKWKKKDKIWNLE